MRQASDSNVNNNINLINNNIVGNRSSSSSQVSALFCLFIIDLHLSTETVETIELFII